MQIRKGLQSSMKEAVARGESMGRGLAVMVFRGFLPGLEEAGRPGCTRFGKISLSVRPWQACLRGVRHRIAFMSIEYDVPLSSHHLQP